MYAPKPNFVDCILALCDAVADDNDNGFTVGYLHRLCVQKR